MTCSWCEPVRKTDEEPTPTPTPIAADEEWSCSRVVGEMVIEFRALRKAVSDLERAGSSQAQSALHRLDMHDHRIAALELKLEAAASARNAILRLVTIVVTLVMATVAILGALKR